MEKRFIYLENVDSTNSYLKELAAGGANEGTAVIAKSQNSGRGRLGRSFFSPTGGLYMSILLRPAQAACDALLITSAAAVAAVRAIERLCGKKCLIKWVNDIYLEDKKISGILCEGALDPNKNNLLFAVLGIGINISDPKGGFPEDIKDRAASIFGKEDVPDNFTGQLANAFYDEFFGIYNAFPKTDFISFYRDRSFLLGKNISYTKGDKTFFAKAIDIDNLCRLVIEENGEIKTLSSGEVTVREVKYEK